MSKVHNIIQKMESPVLVLNQGRDIIEYFDKFTNSLKKTKKSPTREKKLSYEEIEVIESITLLTHVIRDVDDRIRELTIELGPTDRDKVKSLITLVIDLIDHYKAEKEILQSENEVLQSFYDKLASEFDSLEESIVDLSRITDVELQQRLDAMLAEF